jgi:UDP-N-acetylmuramoylalanine--D-glutamate ligase
MQNQFKDRKILIMGLGLNPKGSGASAVKFFTSCGAKVIVTDLRDKKELRKSLRLLRNLPVEFVLGRHRESDFKDVDLIIKNPGVRWDSPYLQIAKKNGVPIETDVGLFWKLCPAPIIAVTGTRGKSTTTALIYKMLKKKYKDSFMGGNIQLSPLNFIEKVKPDSKIVLELSSWMLEDILYVPQGLRDTDEIAKNILAGPRIAVLTNVMPDHLNTYKSFEDYVEAKALIFKNQTQEDFAVLNYDDARVRKLAKKIKAKKIWFSKKHSTLKKLIPLEEIALLGEHNIPNILAAVAVAKLEGVSDRAIKGVLKIFKGLPNRLEFVREFNGIKFYNDTTATMPEATIAALAALAQPKNRKIEKPKNIVLIAGGSDKKLKYNKLAKEIKKY